MEIIFKLCCFANFNNSGPLSISPSSPIISQMTPLLEKARDAITKVGQDQGFNYVIDSSPNGGIILADGKDLLDDVKKELGF